MMEWKNEYKVGIQKIDEQHKKLFDIAYGGEILFYLPEHTDKYDESIHIIEELRTYTKFHFEHEEQIV